MTDQKQAAVQVNSIEAESGEMLSLDRYLTELRDLSLQDIKEICERSIKAGGLSEEETDHLLKVWQRAWNNFCAEKLKEIKNP